MTLRVAQFRQVTVPGVITGWLHLMGSQEDSCNNCPSKRGDTHLQDSGEPEAMTLGMAQSRQLQFLESLLLLGRCPWSRYWAMTSAESAGW